MYLFNPRKPFHMFKNNTTNRQLLTYINIMYFKEKNRWEFFSVFTKWSIFFDVVVILTNIFSQGGRNFNKNVKL